MLKRAAHRPVALAQRTRQPLACSRTALQRTQRLAPLAAGPAPLVYAEGFNEVEELAGARIVVDSDAQRVEYLTKWKDASDATWELAANLSEDLVRDFEEKWWAAARKADVDVMIKMLSGARELLAHVVDENRRSALHFAAALGSGECTKLMVEAGADVDLQDREGFTPLHMAAGYMHTAPMAVLLEAGANPELKDSTGRDVVSLIEGLRGSMPLSMGSVQRRLALEEVANTLTDKLYDEVPPSNVLNMRTAPDGAREFLVSFPDGRDDEWVAERNVAADVLEDYLAGLEYAEAEEVLDIVQVGLERRFKVRWSDGYPTSWEPEEHVPPELISLFAQQQPALFSERTSAEAAASASMPELGTESVEYETQSTRRQGKGAAGQAQQGGQGPSDGDWSGGIAGVEGGQERASPQQREAVGAAR